MIVALIALHSELDDLARRAGWTTSDWWVSDEPAVAITLLQAG